jgi:hypothetical protein
MTSADLALVSCSATLGGGRATKRHERLRRRQLVDLGVLRARFASIRPDYAVCSNPAMLSSPSSGSRALTSTRWPLRQRKQIVIWSSIHVRSQVRMGCI